MHFQLIVLLLLAVMLILVTLQNPNPVTLQFLSWEAQQVPLIIIILISLLLGIIISSVLSLVKQSKLREEIRRLEREVEDLKHPPLKPYEEAAED